VESLKERISALSNIEALKRKLTGVSEEMDIVIEKSKNLPELNLEEEKVYFYILSSYFMKEFSCFYDFSFLL
jgi:hypothetical protein